MDNESSHTQGESGTTKSSKRDMAGSQRGSSRNRKDHSHHSPDRGYSPERKSTSEKRSRDDYDHHRSHHRYGRDEKRRTYDDSSRHSYESRSRSRGRDSQYYDRHRSYSRRSSRDRNEKSSSSSRKSRSYNDYHRRDKEYSSHSSHSKHDHNSSHSSRSTAPPLGPKADTTPSTSTTVTASSGTPIAPSIPSSSVAPSSTGNTVGSSVRSSGSRVNSSNGRSGACTSVSGSTAPSVIPSTSTTTTTTTTTTAATTTKSSATPALPTTSSSSSSSITPAAAAAGPPTAPAAFYQTSQQQAWSYYEANAAGWSEYAGANAHYANMTSEQYQQYYAAYYGQSQDGAYYHGYPTTAEQASYYSTPAPPPPPPPPPPPLTTIPNTSSGTNASTIPSAPQSSSSASGKVNSIQTTPVQNSKSGDVEMGKAESSGSKLARQTFSGSIGAVPEEVLDDVGYPFQTEENPASLFEKIGQIGEGTYGKVYKAKNCKTGHLMALKRIRMKTEKDGFPITAMREIKLLQELKHERIIELQQIMVAKGSVYMVLEYMDHDLAGILGHPNFKFQASHAKSLVKQMLEGLAYIHHMGILHRDIKGSNLLINNKGELKIADFGLARVFQKNRTHDYTNRVITLWYRPPELLLGATAYGPAVDIWSVGCIMLEFFTGRPSFNGTDEISQLDCIYKTMGTPTVETWPTVTTLPWYELIRPKEQYPNRFKEAYASLLSPGALELAEALLSMDPQKRPTAAEALEFDYLKTELPAPEPPANLLDVNGDWHEFESKQRKRQKAAAIAAASSSQNGHSKSSRSSGPPSTSVQSTAAPMSLSEDAEPKA